MAEITISVNEKEIEKLVEKIVADNMITKYHSEFRDTKYGIRKGVEQAVKSVVYSQKDEIIEKCIAVASAELVRKGLPKLIERAIENG